MTKYIFIVGGVMSGIGKGIATASMGRNLQEKGFKVSAIKIDPYINVDAGTMNPIEHGEVFVTDDGAECDQDIGNYERFLDVDLSNDNYITTGRVYQTVINKERNLEYKGKCVEVVPHIPEETISRIKKVARKTQADFVLIEIGGTVGEYQNSLFLEAARMMKLKHPKDVLFVLVSYLPTPKAIGEMKTKPTQYAARSLNTAGIQPDIIITRSLMPADSLRKKKISIFCNISEKDVISSPDVESIYEVPLNFEKDNLSNIILKKLNLRPRKSKKQNKQKYTWEKLVKNVKNGNEKVKIGIVGKYFEAGKFTLMDSYISVLEAVKHAAWFLNKSPGITWVSAEAYEKNSELVKELKNFDGVIVPGGFGSRGIEGKIKAIEFCRKNKIPFLGLCLGMQLAVVEFARNVCGLRKASSAEIADKNKDLVIDVMPEQKQLIKQNKYGGTMRLGAYKCNISPKTHSFRAYSQGWEVDFINSLIGVSERHRHRYELNNLFRELLDKKGMVIAGINPEKDLVEIIELPKNKHPFFVGTQFHPELKSRPLRPHPLFREFIKNCLK